MAVKPDTDKRMAVGIYLGTIFESTSLGYKDVNEYIAALKQQIAELKAANKFMQEKLEAMLKEKESAEEKEQR